MNPLEEKILQNAEEGCSAIAVEGVRLFRQGATTEVVAIALLGAYEQQVRSLTNMVERLLRYAESPPIVFKPEEVTV